MRLFFALLLAFNLWSSVLAVDADIQITRITDATLTDIVDAPQANRTRLVPIAGIVLHNTNTNDAETVDIKLNDGVATKIIYTALSTVLIPDAHHLSPCVIVLKPGQKLQVEARSALEDGINIHASFLEHRPTT